MVWIFIRLIEASEARCILYFALSGDFRLYRKQILLILCRLSFLEKSIARLLRDVIAKLDETDGCQ